MNRPVGAPDDKFQTQGQAYGSQRSIIANQPLYRSGGLRRLPGNTRHTRSETFQDRLGGAGLSGKKTDSSRQWRLPLSQGGFDDVSRALAEQRRARGTWGSSKTGGAPSAKAAWSPATPWCCTPVRHPSFQRHRRGIRRSTVTPKLAPPSQPAASRADGLCSR